jgi:hypothetical protein
VRRPLAVRALAWPFLLRYGYLSGALRGRFRRA